MSSYFTPPRDECCDSQRFTDVSKSLDHIYEPSPRKFVKVQNSQTEDENTTEKIDVIQDQFPSIIPIQLKEKVEHHEMGQRLKMNPKLNISSLKLYILQATIENEDLKYQSSKTHF